MIRRILFGAALVLLLWILWAFMRPLDYDVNQQQALQKFSDSRH